MIQLILSQYSLGAMVNFDNQRTLAICELAIDLPVPLQVLLVIFLPAGSSMRTNISHSFFVKQASSKSLHFPKLNQQ